MRRKRWSRNRKATRGATGHTRHLSYGEIMNFCQGWWLLCNKGPAFWCAWIETATVEDWLCHVDWTAGIERLRKAELTVGIDKGGYAKIRWVSVAARERHRESRRLEHAEYAEYGAKTYREYMTMRYGSSASEWFSIEDEAPEPHLSPEAIEELREAELRKRVDPPPGVSSIEGREGPDEA